MEWIHIPTPGDHYSPKTGSAVITVIHQMCLRHARSRVVVHRGTMDGYDVGERLEVDYGRLGTPPAWAKAVDFAAGTFTRGRLMSAHPYAKAAIAIGPHFDGIIFIHNEPAAVEIVSKLCPKAKICLWVHNELFKTYHKSQTHRVLQLASHVICCSDFIRSGIEKIVGHRARLVTLYNGIDSTVFRPGLVTHSNVPTILFVGRMVPQKAPHILMEACIAIKKSEHQFKLKMVGSAGFDSTKKLTAYEKRLRHLAAELGDDIELVPFQARENVVKFYQSADIFCGPSTWDEPFGLVFLEAMSCGLTVVGARRGGIPEAVGQAGILFEPTDVNSLSFVLARLVQDPVLRQSYSALSRLHAQNFDWSRIYRRLVGIVNAS